MNPKKSIRLQKCWYVRLYHFR